MALIAAVHANQNRNTLGLSVFIKKPAKKVETKSLLLINFSLLSSPPSKTIFLKNKVYTLITNKKPAPNIAIKALCDKASVKKPVKKLQINNKTISLIETPATKTYPALWPLVKLCFNIAKITGPIEILKISPSNKPFKMGAIIIKQ